jgi:hypothetical protein
MSTFSDLHWPWERIAAGRRPLIWVALGCISLSGLVTGLALRTLAAPPHSTPGASSSIPGSTTTGTTSVTVIGTPIAPQRFGATLQIPTPVAPGGSLTVLAHTVLATGDHAAAPGVTCQLVFPSASGIPAPPTQHTDATGTATFTVPIPLTTPAGGYLVTLHATWGVFAATYEVTATVT